MAPETRYVRSGEFDIAYATIGDGPIDLVYVPTWLSHLEILWEEPRVAALFERLAEFSRLIVFDRRGSGLSDGRAGAASLDDQVDDVRAVLDAVGAREPALLAMIEGAAMATVFAATHPERVRALALYAPVVCATRQDGGFEWQDTVEERNVRAAEMLGRWGTGEEADLFAPSLAGDPALRRWFARLERYAAAPSAAAEQMTMLGLLDVRRVLPSVQCPTLVVHRTGDDLFDVRHAQYVAEHVPDARLLELPGRDNLLAVDPERELAAIEEFLTGTHRPAVSDRVLATVLFTDIVDSTGHAVRLGDRSWRELLERHDALMRAEVARHRGRMVKSLGDGGLAVFDAPSRAIGTAVALRDQVHELGLRVRAGLHTGECELLDDQDVGGLAVHIGARLIGEAGPDEVLVTSTVRDLVAGSDIDLRERGERELRGVPGAWRIFAVDA